MWQVARQICSIVKKYSVKTFLYWCWDSRLYSKLRKRRKKHIRTKFLKTKSPSFSYYSLNCIIFHIFSLWFKTHTWMPFNCVTYSVLKYFKWRFPHRNAMNERSYSCWKIHSQKIYWNRRAKWKKLWLKKRKHQIAGCLNGAQDEK